MKKLIVFSMLFSLIAGAAFAQLANGIYVNAWGRGAFVPLWYETAGWQYGVPMSGSEAIFKNGTGVTWDPNSSPRVDFRVNGATDYVGFTVHINSEFLSGTGNGDNGAQLWVRPFGNNWLKLTVANQFIDDTLRGKVTTDTGFENFVLGKSMMMFSEGRDPLNQDVTFNRFAGGRGSENAANVTNTSTPISNDSILSNVFFLSSSPIQGLFIGLMLQGLFPETDLKKTWRLMQLGVGYEIPGIGHARAQYIGGYMGKEKASTDMYQLNDPSKFEAAFALTAIPDLTVDLGFKIWMPVTLFTGRSSYRGLDIAVGGAYRYEAFNVAAMAQVLYLGAYTGSYVHTATSNKGADGVHLVFNLIPAYDFDFGTTGLSFILQTKTAETNASGVIDTQSPWTRFGVGAWYKRGLLGGSIKAGITYAPPPIKTGTTGTGFHGRGILTIPIILEYAFF
jgi:hypothetical protein